MPLKLDVRRPGANKAEPFTVLIIANPVLEAPEGSGTFVGDPIMTAPGDYAAAADYIDKSIFGELAGQAERLLGDPAIAPHVRVLSCFDTSLPATPAHSFVAQEASDFVLVPRRTVIRDFLLAHALVADVVFAVSKSPTHERATSFYTSDDDHSPGPAFVVDGVTMHHRHRYLIPGTVAIHSKATSLTAAHELCHAVSSYTNGKLVDLYYDSRPALNVKHCRPIPPTFATYEGTPIESDPSRQPFGYPGHWQSYHCALPSTSVPALMDDYGAAPTPNACENDVITRRFLRDRVLAKLAR